MKVYMLTENSRLQSPGLSHHYFYVVCYTEAEILPGATFNFVTVKQVTVCFCL